MERQPWAWIIFLIFYICTVVAFKRKLGETHKQLFEREQKIQEIEVRIGKLEVFMKVRKYSNQQN